MSATRERAGSASASRVFAFDPDTKLVSYVGENGGARLSKPVGVAVDADGTVFVSTGDRIVKLSRSNKTPSDVVSGLDKPGRLDVDHSSGDLLVYESGTQQIKRFSSAGALLNTYGAKGGRTGRCAVAQPTDLEAVRALGPPKDD